MYNLENLTKEKILEILSLANDFKNGLEFKPKTKIFAANLFFEDSTRTKTSFEMAERKLGFEVIQFDVSKSSVNKGESLYDTAKTLESIGVNLLVIRHSRNKFYEELESLNIPIINAGDGTANHPSQTILDLMTIQQEFGSFENLKIGIVGDIKHSRVAHSLSETLVKMGSKVYYSGPEEWFDGSDNFKNLDDIIPEVDVLFLLRIQHERHENAENLKIENYLENFGLTKEREKLMKEKAIILHPAPINRNVEIDSHLVECDRSRIFKQMENGVFARMAILSDALHQRTKNQD
ncbi:aspartate carbamoyltransferase catalytic subunit [Halpernia frigidisoli]|uniref:Aspartate carbamoyltransferase n=1 Tax=Halpernia frigidisoli TaxID=1125876 RepID=A0A1I3DGU9_9FLAO|nr:aspartate carbamoyltransferase catalytic subunit [Halpernia frigidisoli]SFH85980.1 aspartate carbamoyltransferase [Halpernia frigidisoli]